MKNIIIAVAVLVGVAGFVQSASALSCEPGAVDFVVCGNGDPMQVGMAWGLMGFQTPQIQSGETIVDEGNVKDVCPAWYGKMGCFDINKTDYYRTRMIDTGRQIKTNGLAGQFTQFTYWINR